MQVEYPFLRYNLFFYVYVLSFYRAARKARAFKSALKALQSKLVDGNTSMKVMAALICHHQLDVANK